MGSLTAGDFVVSALVGLLWAIASPTLAFGLATALTAAALVTMGIDHRYRRDRR